MGRCFFVPGGEGGIEKYIKEKKALAVSDIRCNFAPGFEIQLRVSAAFGIENELSLRSFARDFCTRKRKTRIE